MAKYPLTEQEEIEQWYDPTMHVILLRSTIVANYTVYYNADHDLCLRLFLKGSNQEIELPIPFDATPGRPWPALEVVIKLNQ